MKNHATALVIFFILCGAAAFAQNGPQPIAATPPAGTTNSGASRQDSGSGSGGQAATDSPAARPATPPAPLSVPVVITTVALPAPTVVRVGATITDRPAVVNDADLQNQVVQAVRLQWNDTSGTARIQLRPDYLGEMSVTIRVDQGSVTASLTSDTPAVREWIQAHTDVLRQGLADQGLRLDRVVIGEPSSSERQDREGRRQDQQSDEQQRKPAPRRRDEDEGTFEVNA